MPLVRIDLCEGRTPQQCQVIGETVHNAMKELAATPGGARFQIITQHPPHGLVADAIYLTTKRSSDLIFIQITWARGRTVDQKNALFMRIARDLHEHHGFRKEDVLINLVEVGRDDWSVAEGLPLPNPQP